MQRSVFQRIVFHRKSMTYRVFNTTTSLRRLHIDILIIFCCTFISVQEANSKSWVLASRERRDNLTSKHSAVLLVHYFCDGFEVRNFRRIHTLQTRFSTETAVDRYLGLMFRRDYLLFLILSSISSWKVFYEWHPLTEQWKICEVFCKFQYATHYCCFFLSKTLIID